MVTRTNIQKKPLRQKYNIVYKVECNATEMSLNYGNNRTRTVPLVTFSSQIIHHSQTKTRPRTSVSPIPTMTQRSLSSPVKTYPLTVSAQPRNKSGSRTTTLNGNFARPVTASSKKSYSPGPKPSITTSSPTSSVSQIGRLPRPVSKSFNLPPKHDVK